jgi:hypothetical protein
MSFWYDRSNKNDGSTFILGNIIVPLTSICRKHGEQINQSVRLLSERNVNIDFIQKLLNCNWPLPTDKLRYVTEHSKWPPSFAGNISLWIRSRATIWVVFEADYDIKLLVITSEKREITQPFLNLQKQCYYWVALNFCRNVYINTYVCWHSVNTIFQNVEDTCEILLSCRSASINQSDCCQNVMSTSISSWNLCIAIDPCLPINSGMLQNRSTKD